ncbi:MAG: serine/threonine dehydratase [Pseudozobellia sp.]|nr:serine/threonine dehydratase [Pseudozobellia sp.]MBG47806.1 serine/threonine dehydratase [Pseudozobellia sp.]|tara:strand:- start:381157 stop:382146 length:990 start_codon:yes stop_codon:yes gene_type:complete
MSLVTLRDIEAAKSRIEGFVKKTPIISSKLLNDWLGHEIFFKAECLQKIGAFKARGGCNAVSWLVENGQKPAKIVANSSGNHAQAIAWASKQFNIPATIFMPSYSSKVKIRATESYGAEVVLCETRDTADAKVKATAAEKFTYWIPPFNHEQVIAGQGTAMFEALNEIKDVDAVFAPCGGGGLVSGTMVATRGLSPHTKVFGVEPLNANDAAESLRKNSIQRLKSIPDTLADGVMTMAVGDITFEHLKKLDGIYEVEENRIVYWSQWLTHLLKLHLEPTSAMTMDGVCQWLKTQKTKRRVMVVLTGGNVDNATQNAIWKEDCLMEIPRL